jgi:hypothetical protein
MRAAAAAASHPAWPPPTTITSNFEPGIAQFRGFRRATYPLRGAESKAVGMVNKLFHVNHRPFAGGLVKEVFHVNQAAACASNFSRETISLLLGSPRRVRIEPLVG